MEYTPTYRDKVFNLLLTMESEFNIVEKVNPQTRSEFDDIVKEFIKSDYGKAYGFRIEYKSDYSAIRKTLHPTPMERK